MTVTLDPSPEFKALLEKLRQQEEQPEPSDLIRRAIALYDQSVERMACPDCKHNSHLHRYDTAPFGRGCSVWGCKCKKDPEEARSLAPLPRGG